MNNNHRLKPMAYVMLAGWFVLGAACNSSDQPTDNRVRQEASAAPLRIIRSTQPIPATQTYDLDNGPSIVQVVRVGDRFLVVSGSGGAYSHGALRLGDWLAMLDANGKLLWQRKLEHRGVARAAPYKDGFVTLGLCSIKCFGVIGSGPAAKQDFKPGAWVVYASIDGEPRTVFLPPESELHLPNFVAAPQIAVDGNIVKIYSNVSLCAGQLCDGQENVTSGRYDIRFDKEYVTASSTENYFSLPSYQNLQYVRPYDLVLVKSGFLHVGAYLIWGEGIGQHTTADSHFVALSDRDGKLRWKKHYGYITHAIEVNKGYLLVGVRKGIRYILINREGLVLAEGVYPSSGNLIAITDVVNYDDGVLISGIKYTKLCTDPDMCEGAKNPQDVLVHVTPNGQMAWAHDFPANDRVIDKMVVLNKRVMAFTGNGLRITEIKIIKNN